MPFFFDLEKYELLEECEGIFYEVVFTNDSYRFLVVEQGMIKIWNMETFKEISRTHVPDMGFFLNCDLFNTKDYLIYNNATVIDIYTGEEVCNYNQYNAGSETTSDMCISPDDEMIMFDNYGLYKTCWKHIGVEEQEAIEIINCYPNPAKTKLIVNLQIEIPENIIIAITDITGNIIREYDMGIAKVGINEYTLDISDLSAGAYFISASGSNVNLSQKIVIGG